MLTEMAKDKTIIFTYDYIKTKICINLYIKDKSIWYKTDNSQQIEGDKY